MPRSAAATDDALADRAACRPREVARRVCRRERPGREAVAAGSAATRARAAIIARWMPRPRAAGSTDAQLSQPRSPLMKIELAATSRPSSSPSSRRWSVAGGHGGHRPPESRRPRGRAHSPRSRRPSRSPPRRRRLTRIARPGTGAAGIARRVRRGRPRGEGAAPRRRGRRPGRARPRPGTPCRRRTRRPHRRGSGGSANPSARLNIVDGDRRRRPEQDLAVVDHPHVEARSPARPPTRRGPRLDGSLRTGPAVRRRGRSRSPRHASYGTVTGRRWTLC